MTFVQGFYSFSVDLTHSDRNLSTRLRFKIPRHPLEPAEYMLARVVAYVDSYEEGLEFSKGLFEPKEPALWKHSAIGAPETIIEVGELDADRLSRSLRRNDAAVHRVFFYNDAQISAFCHGIRGSKTNWIAPVEFLMLEPEFLENLSGTMQSSSNWQMTIVDGQIYLLANGSNIEGKIEKLDMWARYQQSLATDEVT